jgi:hypothetical protein
MEKKFNDIGVVRWEYLMRLMLLVFALFISLRWAHSSGFPSHQYSVRFFTKKTRLNLLGCVFGSICFSTSTRGVDFGWALFEPLVCAWGRWNLFWILGLFYIAR